METVNKTAEFGYSKRDVTVHLSFFDTSTPLCFIYQADTAAKNTKGKKDMEKTRISENLRENEKYIRE